MTTKKIHRYTVSVQPATAEMLEEISKLDGVSVSAVIRDCLRNTLPAMREVSRFLHDPHTTDAGALRLAADMEAMLKRIALGAVGTGDAGETAPPPAALPPSSNTGAHSSQEPS